LFLPSVPVCFTGTVINNSSLPLELLEFTAQAKEKHIALRWKTASEQDFSGFELQRSADGIQFEKINWIAAKGGSSNTYNYDDHRAQQGVLYYYRLKMLDEDGQFSYSGIQSALLEKGWSEPHVIPNPTRGRSQLSFEAPESGAGQLELTDSNGKSVFRRPVIFEKGENKIDLDVSGLNPGTYVLQLIYITSKWQTRIVISR